MSILFNNNTIKNIYVKINQLSQEITKGYIKSDGALKQFYSKQNEGQEGLPDGYQQVEYIYNNAGAYINTGITGCYTYKCTFKNSSALSGASTTIPMGLLFGLKYNNINCYAISQRTGVFIYYNREMFSRSISNNIDKDITLSFNINPNHSFIININNVDYSYESTNELSELNNLKDLELTLFGYNNNNNIMTNRGLCIYSFEVYSDPSMGEKIAKFVPCKNSNGIVGMYNLIGRTFHPNAGSGGNNGLLAEGDPNIPT